MDRGFNNSLFSWANKELKPIFKEMEKARIDSNDLDAVLKLERIANDETRAGVANIKGFDEKTSKEVLKELEKTLGKDRAAALFQAADDLRTALRDVQLKYPDLWTPEQKKLIESNKFYAPFNVLYNESLNIPYYIKSATGNIDKDFNAVANSLLRSQAVINFGERNVLKKTIIDEFLNSNDTAIQKAKKTVWKDDKGGLHVEFQKPPKDHELVKIKRNGDLEGYYLPTDIANSLNGDNISELQGPLKLLRAITKPFKKLYTELNPGFQVVNFLFRDWGITKTFFGPEWTRAQLGKSTMTPWDIIANNTYRNLFASMKQGKYYLKALRNLKEKNLFNRFTPTVEEGLKNHVIEVDGAGMYKLEPSKLSKQEEAATKYILQTMGLTEKGGKWDRFKSFIKGIGQTLEETPKLATYMYLKDIGVLTEKTSTKYNQIIRNYVGSPNFWKMAKNNQEISSVFMFYNPIIRAWENLGKKAFVANAAGVGSRNAFWWRMIRKAIIPAIVGTAAAEGYFGDDIKRQYNRLSKYLKNNYLSIPIGETENGKTRAITIPLDEDARLVHALTRMALELSIHGGDKATAKRTIMDILAYTGGQVPSTVPTIKIASAWATTLAGGNPYDNFRQQHIFLANEEKLPMSEKAKIMSKWTLNQSGQLKLELHDRIDNKTMMEKVLQYAPVIGRFLRITNTGEYEEDQKITKEIANKQAIKLLEKTEAINDLAEKYHKDKTTNLEGELYKLAKDRLGEGVEDKDIVGEMKLLYSSLQDKYMSAYGNVHYRSIINASNEQKIAIINNIWDKKLMTKKEFGEFLKEAAALKIISVDVLREVSKNINQ